MESFSVEYASLAMQVALLGEVTPELRAVVIHLDTEERIFYAYFYYDGESSEKMIDLWQCAVTEASADLGDDFVESEILRLDYPEAIPSWGYYSYLRKEPNGSKNKERICHRVKIAEMSIGYALLAVQDALLGVVTPELRTVIIDFVKEQPLLYIRFYYHGEIPEQLIKLWECAIAEARTSFGPDCSLDAGIERVDYPAAMPFRGRYAYIRKE